MLWCSSLAVASSLSHHIFKALSWTYTPFLSICLPSKPHPLIQLLSLWHLVKMIFKSKSLSPRTKHLTAEWIKPHCHLEYYSAHLKLTPSSSPSNLLPLLVPHLRQRYWGLRSKTVPFQPFHHPLQMIIKELQ